MLRAMLDIDAATDILSAFFFAMLLIAVY